MESWHYVGPYVFWIFLIIIIIAGMFFGYLKNRSRDETIRDLAERGQPIPRELFGPTYGKDQRGGLLVSGLVMLFIGIGLIAMAWSMNGYSFAHSTDGMPMLVGFIPGGIGIALILSHFLLRMGKDDYS